MGQATLWWLVAGGVVALELVTGTFYLLMLALGLCAGAIAAHSGASLSVQLIVAAGVGVSAVVAWHLYKRRTGAGVSARTLRSVNLDIGEVVQIEAWAPDGTATVKYRGASWTAIHRPGVSPRPGRHRVAELVGNRLLVEPE